MASPIQAGVLVRLWEREHGVEETAQGRSAFNK